MRKILQLFLFLLFLTAVTSSCELFDDCKTCSLVTYIDGEYDNQSEGELFCGEELEEIENEPTIIRGDLKTRWECY